MRVPAYPAALSDKKREQAGRGGRGLAFCQEEAFARPLRPASACGPPWAWLLSRGGVKSSLGSASASARPWASLLSRGGAVMIATVVSTLSSSTGCVKSTTSVSTLSSSRGGVRTSRWPVTTLPTRETASQRRRRRFDLAPGSWGVFPMCRVSLWTPCGAMWGHLEGSPLGHSTVRPERRPAHQP